MARCAAFVPSLANRSGSAWAGTTNGPVNILRVRTCGPMPVAGAPHAKRVRAAGVSMVIVTPAMAHKLTAVYAGLMGVGGVFAFLKTKSKPSLIFGILATAALSFAYKQHNIEYALGTAMCLCMVFYARFTKTKKMMPAGGLGIVSFVFGMLFALAYKRI
ncbi:Protein FATTY ACID EXPORT 2, chloroplastic [Porphyridium purpureum]|uniref:Protein FATTY ACID EXPORT 2, chloroplastic n=1 Tax=Porphyridium purpureum TaxID=35688 RepID=A0A5J4YWS9_PORPP|nr:Protein FATTY ACID EXPORT 2, chloroplastic [Porphyridium purpureum]|eukprot:POR6588..scf209_3